MTEDQILQYASEISEPPHWESHRVIKDLLAIIKAKNKIISDLSNKDTRIFSTLNQLEAQAIEKTIKKHNRNLTEAAKELGIGRATLYRKMKEFGLL